MNDDTIYLLDADVFIEAARRYYAFDIAPRFWEQLEYYASRGNVMSIDRVFLELKRGKDELFQWASSGFSTAFASTDQPEVIQSYRDIINWVQSQAQFKAFAKADFANGADGWLIAFARVNNCVIVTHEVFDPYAKKKVPIPNVCREFQMQPIDTFEMLRALKIKFS
jgi:hypothetical protein